VRPAGSPKDISWVALFIGPVLLGSFVANGIFRVACDGRASFVSGGDASQASPIFLLFAIVLLASRIADPLLRFGLFAFALWNAMRIYVWITRDRLPDFVGWAGVISAMLFTAAGLRTYPWRHRVAIGVTIFLVVFSVSLYAQRLRRDIVGRTSIISDSFFCGS
jgi:hypothetical protein